MCRPLSEARWDPVTQIEKNTKGLKPLTDAVIDKFQNYFGTALRANTGGTSKKKWPMLSGKVSCIALVIKNNIIIHYANSHKRAGVNTRGIDVTYSNMYRVCPKT